MTPPDDLPDAPLPGSPSVSENLAPARTHGDVRTPGPYSPLELAALAYARLRIAETEIVRGLLSPVHGPVRARLAEAERALIEEAREVLDG